MKNALTVIFALLLLCACGSPVSPQATIEKAETDLDAGKSAQARKSCARLLESGEQLSVEQLCRLAVIYSRLAEKDDDLDDMAVGATCLKLAAEQDADSVEIFASTMDLSDLSYLTILREVCIAVSEPTDFAKVAIETPEDTLMGQEPIDTAYINLNEPAQ